MKIMSEQIKIWKEKLNANDEQMTWIAENVLAEILENEKNNEEAKKGMEKDFKNLLKVAEKLKI